MQVYALQNLFRPQAQNSMQGAMGQLQDAGLETVIRQVNANYGAKQTRDTVELSRKALELLNAAGPEKTEEAPKPEMPFGYQKYAEDMYSKEEWAENAILAQRDGIRTVSDVVDYAKSKLQYTMSKISELENYLSGTGPHSDPGMTKELAETYLHNYRQSIQTDYTDIIKSLITPHRNTVDEYDGMSGGLASKAMENSLNSISAETLGLSGLPKDPQEIMEALEKASAILDGMMQDVENTYKQLTGVERIAEPAGSTSIFDGNTSHDFFASQMEQSHRIIDTAQMKFTGRTLAFR
ncbi:hypothetical protein AALC17_16595 [Oscillospiraceae bacterium 38-13]